VPIDEDAAADGSVTEALEPVEGATLAGVVELHEATRTVKAIIETTLCRGLNIGRAP
jgi:hypothetical protein